MDPEPEQLNLFHEVEDESERVDNEHPPTLNIEIEVDRGRLRIAYQNYQTKGRRITAIEKQFEAYNDMDLPLDWDAFGPHPSPVRAQAELDMLLTIRAMQRTRIFSLHPGWMVDGFSDLK